MLVNQNFSGFFFVKMIIKPRQDKFIHESSQTFINIRNPSYAFILIPPISNVLLTLQLIEFALKNFDWVSLSLFNF